MSHDDMSTGPIDVGAVRRDEMFIDDLAAGRAADVHDRVEHELAGLLAQWRADSLTGAVPATPTISEVEAAIAHANERERRGGLSRRLRIISGAAAVLAVAAAGLLVLSEGSHPGDPLWSVKQVVFADQARQTQAQVDAQENLSEARKALAAGDTVKATELIAKAEKNIAPIRDAKEANALRDLIAQLKKQDPRRLIPSLPLLPTMPSTPTQPPTVSDTDKDTNPTVTLKPPTSTTTTHTTPSTTPTVPSTTKPETSPTQPPVTTTTTVTPTATATASATPTVDAPGSSVIG